jgi:hypothetical protein
MASAFAWLEERGSALLLVARSTTPAPGTLQTVRPRSINLVSVNVEVGEGKSIAALDLVDGWASHVLRLLHESGASVQDDDLASGAHDWIAALYLRDRVQRVVDAAVPATVEATDELFRSFTKPDEEQFLRRAAHDLPREPWWWGRIPTAGPVARELSAIERSQPGA